MKGKYSERLRLHILPQCLITLEVYCSVLQTEALISLDSHITLGLTQIFALVHNIKCNIEIITVHAANSIGASSTG